MRTWKTCSGGHFSGIRVVGEARLDWLYVQNVPPGVASSLGQASRHQRLAHAGVGAPNAEFRDCDGNPASIGCNINALILKILAQSRNQSSCTSVLEETPRSCAHAKSERLRTFLLLQSTQRRSQLKIERH